MLYQTWEQFFKQETNLDQILKKVNSLINQEKTIYPPKNLILNAFNLTSLDKTKVVILGQDPYHQENQANGLAFSVTKTTKIPPSLKNIYKALAIDYIDFNIPKHGDLTNWAKQGVLLLNTCLSVEDSKPNSHKNLGWLEFTDQVIKLISTNNSNVVFLLWGKPAIEKAKLINTEKHLILTAPHPSPLSAYRGFFECKHFSKTNEYLKKYKQEIIDWNNL